MLSVSEAFWISVVAASTAVAGSLASVMVSARTPLDGARPLTAAPSRQSGAATATTVSIAGAPVKGARSARIAIIEYADFQCPYCAVFFRESLPTLDREYVRTGKVLLVFKHRPIPSIHPNAMKAASAAECAGEQGSFWPMHDLLFSDQRNFSTEGLLTRARRLQLDGISFGECLELGRAEKRVNGDMADATALGITGTPTFLLGTIDRRTNVVHARERLEGTQPMSVLRLVLDRLLVEAK